MYNPQMISKAYEKLNTILKNWEMVKHVNENAECRKSKVLEIGSSSLATKYTGVNDLLDKKVFTIRHKRLSLREDAINDLVKVKNFCDSGHFEKIQPKETFYVINN